MPEQLGSDDDVVCGSAGESLVLLVLQVGLIVDDEVEYRARQSRSATSTSWPRAGARSGMVGGSSSILTVGELRACTKMPPGTSARLEPILESTSAATL